jgi:outer membrane protein OmpA-like peptidoglycan-associated protein
MSQQQASNWISLSDMMTGLMLIFLLIAVLVTMQITQEQKQRQQSVAEYQEVKDDIYADLNKAFGSKEDEWGISITRDLVIKFENPDLLFGVDQSDLKVEYEVILDKFVPLYIGIINKEEYKDRIKEVRIEGHTADVSDAHPTYMSTISLSQNRSNSVLEYILESNFFSSLDSAEQDKLRFWFSANGLGNGRTLDQNSQFTYVTNAPISPNSRRVEFRILTDSESLIDEIFKQDINI